jgi:hypothetical protein
MNTDSEQLSTDPAQPPLLCWSQRDGYYEVPSPPSLEWQRDEDDVQRFQRLGYEQHWTAGDDQGVFAHVYRAQVPPNGAPPYIAVVGDFCTYDEIALWTRPDAIAMRDRLFARYPLENDLTREAFRLAEKAFQAWHGHESMGACFQCDPRGWERRQQARVRAKARAAQRSQESSGA